MCSASLLDSISVGTVVILPHLDQVGPLSVDTVGKVDQGLGYLWFTKVDSIFTTDIMVGIKER